MNLFDDPRFICNLLIIYQHGRVDEFAELIDARRPVEDLTAPPPDATETFTEAMSRSVGHASDRRTLAGGPTCFNAARSTLLLRVSSRIVSCTVFISVMSLKLPGRL